MALFFEIAGSLADCNKNLRRLVHSVTQRVYLQDAQDITLLAKGGWPQLAVGLNSIVFLVRSRQHMASLHHAKQNIVTALSFLQKPVWRQLYFMYYTTGCYATGSFRWEAILDRPPLKTSYDTLQKLAIDAEARLVQCHEELRLAMNEEADLSVIAAEQQFTAAYLQQLATLQWAELASLHLPRSRLGAKEIAVVVKASLPNLQTLDLSHNRLDGAAMAVVVRASLPNLRTLNLSHNRLDGAAMMLLALGEWPKLMRLDFYHNDFKTTGIVYLTSAYWPELLWVNVSQDATCAQLYALSWIAAFLPVPDSDCDVQVPEVVG